MKKVWEKEIKEKWETCCDGIPKQLSPVKQESLLRYQEQHRNSNFCTCEKGLSINMACWLSMLPPATTQLL